MSQRFMRYVEKSNAIEISLWRRETSKPNCIKVNQVTFQLKPMETGHRRRAAASGMSDVQPSS